MSLLDIPLINLIWLCQSLVIRSPCSNAGLLHEGGAMRVRAARHSSPWDTTNAAAPLPR